MAFYNFNSSSSFSFKKNKKIKSQRKTMRKYQGIWERIKKNKTCSVSAPRAVHRRIIKAVVKEKDKDLVFKLECSERHTRAILFSSRNGLVITFTLRVALADGDI